MQYIIKLILYNNHKTGNKIIMLKEFCDISCKEHPVEIVISLTGQMPDCSNDIRISDPPALTEKCLSVDSGEVFYTLRSGWEKRELALSISLFKYAKRTLRRKIRPAAHPVIPARLQCVFVPVSRLRL